jgi:membrane protein
MLAVVMSITSTFLKKEGEEKIDQFIVKMVASVTPEAPIGTNDLRELQIQVTKTNQTSEATDESSDNTNQSPASNLHGSSGTNNPSAPASSAEEQKIIKARKAIASSIYQFIQNTRSGALGVTGSVLLIFVAISMLSRIEITFNDIWGVTRGRGWFTRIVLYWGVLSLLPLCVVVAMGLASGPNWQWTKALLTTMPLIGKVVFEILSVTVLCLTFGAFYMLIPNTKVNWRAALVGGFVGGLLFHLNNAASVLYVSRVISNS